MRAYIIRRLLLIIPTLFLVTVIIFFTIRLLPGTVIDLMILQHGARQAGGTSVELTAEAIRHDLGLDVPLIEQYGRWMGGIILRGDLGKSMWTGYSATDEIAARLPVSFELGIMALVIALLIAFPIGIYSAIRQDTWGDYIGRSLAIAFIAIPSFWLATMVMVFPSIWWDWTPPMELIRFTDDPMGNLGQFIIPASLLGMVMSGTTMRMTRTMMLEVLRQDYIRTAWSKGLRERVVVLRHALRNALIPVVTIIGMNVPVLVGGAVILEQIFVLPGMGRLLLEVITRRDYVVLSGLNLVVASFVLLANLATDLTYAFLDPRIRYG